MPTIDGDDIVLPDASLQNLNGLKEEGLEGSEDAPQHSTALAPNHGLELNDLFSSEDDGGGNDELGCSGNTGATDPSSPPAVQM